ncbi:sodium:solute symporter [Phaeobacter gallaeciensis]|uniref:histidine kinase n=1 Tax=Phaeobacter gallaeciensis TaxID=60890 RepID=A0A1B0ZMS6_9RHOB|nr:MULTISPECIES: sensor histidine kinase [Phaeobacter]MEE2634309.1 sensor histidine kinase [Pseudomonadota bacterium]ANP35411.1 sodium:solute symporter [Phaeobacter gallaeciensis]MDE4062043.1 sensor histidine kinase [Phaeobacter gallaeciensis]MDE4125010.1 sensor histidine kinase [Phaeobacter gallaeciensis]MDE4129482.1 sensor histidine kinase [Phaeobacter gallaeciensis]
MASLNVLVLVCFTYVALLFLVAFLADRMASRGRSAAWMRSPLTYTLSLSIYCTAWTFYGAVGYAARSGLEFITIYLGPTLVMLGWWWGLRKLVRVGRSQRVTSIADLLSARYGKSNTLAIGVTILAVIGVTPYISLQLQSITLSFSIFAEADHLRGYNETKTVFWVSAGLAVFAILFGTRNLNANERHHGVVTAIALEAVVKLVALLAVGIFVVWGIAGGLPETFARIDASRIGQWQVDGGRWATITFLAAAAFVCLPRMFQVMVVENEDERHLRIAAWAFPTYLLLMSMFVVPIAAIGLELLPTGANPDLFVLTLPLHQGQQNLAMLSFLGGFSSATSMVIVAAMALSTMVSNHIVMPIWLRLQGAAGASVSGDVRDVVLFTRRVTIAVIMALGYFYYTLSGGGAALAAIGLISFAGVAQMLPALVGGLFWRGATRSGALAGLTVGFGIWAYTMLLPTLGGGVLPDAVLAEGLFGLSWLRPHALFGIEALDPTVHAVLWSIGLNAVVFCIVSLASFPSPMERLQGAQFVNVFDHSSGPRGWTGSVAQSEDLMVMSQRILGATEAQAFFQRELARQGGRGSLPEPTPVFLERLERELSASIGAAAAHAMIGQIVGGSSVSVEDLLAVADETAQMLEYSNRLEMQSAELSRTARKLRETNEKLTQISRQKDAFLSQVSHELRTPMTSIRAFSEILRDDDTLAQEGKARYATIIHDEALRLTRLLNDLLDLSVLESGQVSLNMTRGTLKEVLDHAVSTAVAGFDTPMRVLRDPASEDIKISSDLDRLAQVFINLIANAQKYCDAEHPELSIHVSREGSQVLIDFIDNGSGIPPEFQQMIFEKFSRVSPERAGGAGLGLAICREIVQRLDGDISYLAGASGGAFRVTLSGIREKAA